MKNERTPPARAGRRPITPFIGLLAAIALSACASAGGAPTPVPGTPVPTPVDAWATFESERYGYRIDHPADWEPRENVGTATFSILRPYSAGADVITSEEFFAVQTRHGVQVAATEVEPGTDLLDLTNDIHMPCGGPSKHEEVTLDGEPALFRRFSCNGNRPVYLQVTAVHGDLAYVVWLMTSERPHADDRPEYQAMIESFEFTDVTAAGGG